MKLLPSDVAAFDASGRSVSVSGEVIVIGVPLDDDNGPDSGSAYVYRWNGVTWIEEQKILPDDGAAGDHFGFAVAVSGDLIVAAGRLADNVENGMDSGSAYVFRWNGSSWEQEQKLTAPDGGPEDWFGIFVSAFDDVVIIGADGHDEPAVDSGAAYVFRWNGLAWDFEQKLAPSDVEEGDHFGFSVSLSGNAALVGSLQDDDNGIDAGSAYVFRWNGSSWEQEQKLLASDGEAFDWFSVSVNISDDVALVGARMDDDLGSESGSAYVYRWSGASWVEEQKLIPSDGAAVDRFGVTAAGSGDLIVIGANGDDDNGINSGSAYVFRWDGFSWVEEEKLHASDGADNALFAHSLSLSGNVLVVGADAAGTTKGPFTGSSYIFYMDGCAVSEDCDDGNVCTCDLCTPSGCLSAPVTYGDVHPPPCGNGLLDVDDILCTLLGFADPQNCPSGDVFPPCAGNKLLDVDDILQVIAAFSGVGNPCGC